MSVPTALYRHFDAGGRLLYVGVSLSAVGRLAQHIGGSHWAQQIARVEIEWHTTREAAALAERAAIKTERPAHNKVGSPKSVKPIPQGEACSLGRYLDLTSMNQADFARLVGVPEATVSRWASGKMIPRKQRMREIQAITDGAVTPASWFLPDEAAA